MSSIEGTARGDKLASRALSQHTQTAPLAIPNGVAIDLEGNVVVNIGENTVLTFNLACELINTEHAAESGNDGLVITELRKT